MSNIIPIQFEGHSMRFYSDGWFDATTAAEKFGKVPNEFLRLPETESYIQALERRYGKIPYVKTSRARKDRGGGTWLHPKLAVLGIRDGIKRDQSALRGLQQYIREQCLN